MEKANCVSTGIAIEDTDFGYTLSVIGGKYKMIILYWIAGHKVIRYNELKRKIGSISHKTLSLALKELERDEIIVRTEYPRFSPFWPAIIETLPIRISSGFILISFVLYYEFTTKSRQNIRIRGVFNR